MRQASFVHRGPAPDAGVSLPDIGRVERFELPEGRELWRGLDERSAALLLERIANTIVDEDLDDLAPLPTREKKVAG